MSSVCDKSLIVADGMDITTNDCSFITFEKTIPTPVYSIFQSFDFKGSQRLRTTVCSDTSGDYSFLMINKCHDNTKTNC